MKLPQFALRLLNRIGWDNPYVQRVFIKTRQAGVVVNPDTAMTYSAVFSAIRIIAESIAALEFCVYTVDNGKKVENDKSTLWWLLNVQANPEMSAMSFKETIIAHCLGWGNGYAEIERDMAGRPAALWPLTPDRVTPRRRPETGALYYQVTHENGGIAEIEPANILHLHGLGFDGVVGYSIVTMAAKTIGLGIAQETFSQAFYENGTTFGGYVEVPATLKPSQIAETESYLNEKHGGPANAFRTRVVPKGSTHHNPSMPLNDAQFLESRQFNVTEIARWFRLPPHKLAELTRSTNNNIEHQGIEFVTDSLVPWGVRFEQEINIKMVGQRAIGKTYVKVDFDDAMRGDAKSRAEFYRIMSDIGAFSVNDILEMEDRNPIGPEGDARLVQVNRTTLKRLVDNPGVVGQSASTAPSQSHEPTPADLSAAHGSLRRAA